MGDPGFIRRFREARRPGVYLRVLEKGIVTVGDPVTYEPAPAIALSVLELQDLYYAPQRARSRAGTRPRRPDRRPGAT